MQRKRKIRLGGAVGVMAFAIQAPVLAQSAPPAPQTAASGNDMPNHGSDQDIVVTANRKSERIQNVGMSIQAASGEQLEKIGITDVSQLSKIVPGFNATISPLGTPVLSVRGINYYDQALASNPAVSLYTDEVPLPFSIMATGATLDLQRVEVLKGPQGTLYGENATGGAINFIPNAPTDRLEEGVDASYGRFNTLDAQAFVSGPLGDTVTARLALHTTQSGPWQQSYTRDATSGRQDIINGRLTTLWQPSDRLEAKVTLSGFLDRSESQQPQLEFVRPYIPAQADPRVLSFPLAPRNPRAADWSQCVNTSPLDQPYNTATPGAPLPTTASECVGYRKHNSMYMGALRLDYKLTDAVKLTSITSHERFGRYQPIDISGTSLQVQQNFQTGHIETTFQEFRLSGNLFHNGSWIIGVNYQHDASEDQSLESIGNGSVVPLFGLFRTNTELPRVSVSTNTFAAYANGDAHLTDTLKFNAGVRFTQSDKDGRACLADTGSGVLAAAFSTLRALATGTAPVPIAAGTCVTLGPAPTFSPGLVSSKLDQNNVSWRTGLDWKVTPELLVYGNVSKGYKAGGFPALGLTSYTEFRPATQESLLAFESGFKSDMFNHQFVFNGALYYYDYRNKQTQGDIIDPLFGPAEALVNVPRSHVLGFEFSGVLRPGQGLTISPAVNYTFSRVDSCNSGEDPGDPNTPGGAGCYNGIYHNYDRFGAVRSYTGSALPFTPRWQASVDGEYGWGKVHDGRFYLGGTLTYQSASQATFQSQAGPAQDYDNLFALDSHTLLDLRAGYERSDWKIQIFGRNITNRYYDVAAQRSIDTVVYYTGMPATYGISFSCKFR